MPILLHTGEFQPVYGFVVKENLILLIRGVPDEAEFWTWAEKMMIGRIIAQVDGQVAMQECISMAHALTVIGEARIMNLNRLKFLMFFS